MLVNSDKKSCDPYDVQNGDRKIYHRSVIEGNAKIEPLNIRKQSINNTMINDASLISNSSVIEESTSISRRPKSSQGGIHRAELMKSANRAKNSAVKKHRKLVAHANEFLIRQNENSVHENSLKKYVESLSLSKGMDSSIRNEKSQPKYAAFLKHFIKRKSNEISGVIPKVGSDNQNSRKGYFRLDVIF